MIYMSTEQALAELVKSFTQDEPFSGGIHTSPEQRLFILALCMMTKRKNILETGYDAGFTLRALALTGEKIVGIDNGSEYPGVKKTSNEVLKKYPNVESLKSEALTYFSQLENASLDFIYIDDNHGLEHVKKECEDIKRVLAPGGVAAFHDTKYAKIWPIVKDVFQGWEMINLSSFSSYLKLDVGLGLVRKPE